MNTNNFPTKEDSLILDSRFLVFRQPLGNILFDYSEGDLVAQLNNVAVEFLSLCNGNYTKQAIISYLAKEYQEKEKKIEKDIELLINNLKGAIIIKNNKNASLQSIRQEPPVVGSKQKTTIMKANIELTENCNLRCGFCCNSSGRALKDELNYHEWKRVLNILRSLHVRGATFSGGEIFTRKDCWQILEETVTNFSVVILSNGWYLSELSTKQKEIIQKVKKVQISIDSFLPERHDSRRGNGSWQRATKAVELLKSLEVKVDIASIYFPDTTELEIEQMINFSEQIGVDHILFSPLERKGRSKNVRLPLGYYDNITNFLEKKSKEKKILYAPSWETKRTCLFNVGMITIRPNGFLKPCLQPDETFAAWSKNLIEGEKVFSLESLPFEELSIFKAVRDISYPVSYKTCYTCRLFNGVCPAGCIVAPVFLKRKNICKRREVIVDEEAI